MCVRLSVTDVTSLPQRVLWERGYNVYCNAYAGNESPNCRSCRHWSALIVSRHSHSYRRATKARQTTLEQAKTALSTSWTLSQATKVRLRYKRVDFLGTANRIPMVDMLIVIAGRYGRRRKFCNGSPRCGLCHVFGCCRQPMNAIWRSWLTAWDR